MTTFERLFALVAALLCFGVSISYTIFHKKTIPLMIKHQRQWLRTYEKYPWIIIGAGAVVGLAGVMAILAPLFNLIEVKNGANRIGFMLTGLILLAGGISYSVFYKRAIPLLIKSQEQFLDILEKYPAITIGVGIFIGLMGFLCLRGALFGRM